MHKVKTGLWVFGTVLCLYLTIIGTIIADDHLTSESTEALVIFPIWVAGLFSAFLCALKAISTYYKD